MTFRKTEAELKERVREIYAEQRERQEKAELRRKKEHLRRTVYAALYEPKRCMGDPITAQVCTRYAIAGAGFCAQHGGSTAAMQNAAKTRLLYLVEPALRVLNKAMASYDMNIAVKAAIALLDRAGFHPKATLEVQEKVSDLSEMSTAQLKARAHRLLQAMEDSPTPEEVEAVEQLPEPKEDDLEKQLLEVIEEDEKVEKGSIH